MIHNVKLRGLGSLCRLIIAIEECSDIRSEHCCCSLLLLLKSIERVRMSSANQTLEELTSEAVAIRLPVRVFIGIVAVSGAIGNSHVLYLYYTRFKRSTYRWFVLSLAVIDMTGCCVSMPFEIVDESLPHSFSDPVSCKLFRFVNYIVALTCAFTLVLIASERYRKICKPYGKQMSERRAKKYVIAVIVVTFIVSAPVLYIYGPKTIKINEFFYGKECTWGDHMADHSTFGYAYAGFITLIIVICMFCLIVIYSIIGLRLKKHERQMRARLNRNHRNSVKLNRTFCSSSDLFKMKSSVSPNSAQRLSHSCEELCDSPKVHLTNFSFFQQSYTKTNATRQEQENDCDVRGKSETSEEGQGKRDENINISNHSKTNVIKEASNLVNNPDAKTATPAPEETRNLDMKLLSKSFPVERKEKNITKVLVAITSLFVASFLPYIIVVIVFFTNPHYENNMTSSELVLYLTGFRLYNINNMANPIFYFLFDLKFREEFLTLYRSFCGESIGLCKL